MGFASLGLPGIGGGFVKCGGGGGGIDLLTFRIEGGVAATVCCRLRLVELPKDDVRFLDCKTKCSGIILSENLV